MLIAALTATETITAEAGAAALITLGTVQVALAMPEQIFGVIKNFILKTGDKVQAPDFAMTAAELDLKEELAVGLEKKLHHAKDLVTKVMNLKPFMLSGDVEEVFRSILMDKELMEIFNVLRPGCLNGLFGSLFTMEPLVDGMNMLKDNIVILRAPIDKLLAVEWVHCVDFKIGLDALYDIKETIDVLAGTIKAMGEGKVADAVNLVMGSSALIGALEVLDPELLRNMLKTAFQPPGVKKAIQAMMATMPDELMHPFEDFLTFIDELDASDLDAIVGDFCALVKQFKVKIPKKLTEMRDNAAKKATEAVSGALDIPDFNFPGDFLQALDPIDILTMLGQKVPPPFDMAFSKALDLARFAPLLPMLNALKNGSLEEAVSCIMHPDISGPFMKLLAKFDNETPRQVLKSVFFNDGVQQTIEKYCASAPKQLRTPFRLLQVHDSSQMGMQNCWLGSPYAAHLSICLSVCLTR